MTDRFAALIDQHAAETVTVLGPTITFLTPPDGTDDAPCLLRGTIPPGVVVPLHSHPDPETFVMESGDLQALAGPDGYRDWIRVRPGDIHHVPGDVPHAFRNVGEAPAVTLIATTARIARFFRAIGGAPDQLEAFLAASERYGYWNATPEENAAIGLVVPAGA